MTLTNSQFKRVGIFTKPNGVGITDTLHQVTNFLQQHGLEVHTGDSAGDNSDLAIVIGGDGSMLKAARAIVNKNIPIIGINRGNLGFLADVNPNHLEDTLTEILQGNYCAEQRTMLQVSIMQNDKIIKQHLALNDVVLHHGNVARLIEFSIYIDDQFVVDQRSDGLITATPTGSTAYALSGGGPIIYPTLDVINLVPMFAHTLSARPIVVHKNSKIKLVLNPRNKTAANVSCDGQTHIALNNDHELHIQTHINNLQLLHPKSYNYFAVLREKLGWNILC